MEAYQLYLKGRTLLHRRGRVVPPAAQCFEQAVKIDSHYTQAWAGLADSYTVAGYLGLARPQVCTPKALEAARRAVALDPSLADAHTALAISSLMGAWDKTQAEKKFLHALELNPKYIQARLWYAFTYLQLSTGRLEGVIQAKLMLDSDPLSSYANTVYGMACLNSDRPYRGSTGGKTCRGN